MRGQFFDGRSSARYDVEVQIGIDRVVRVTGAGAPREYRLAEVEISERIGSTPRTLRFADGSACEIADNDAVDAALEQLDLISAQHRVHRLESRWHYALAAGIAIVLITWGAIQFGIPAVARHVAMALPASTDQALGRQSLELLDRTMFAPTELSPERQAAIRGRFAGITRDLQDGHDYRLEFRRGEGIGANAFALPSGIVVMTDELVALAQSDDELAAVLAHEIGHVVHRHSLRMLLQNSATSLLMLALVGDISSASVLVASVPTVLVQAKHSRQFEAEADDYAYAWLDRAGISRRTYGAILERLEEKYGGQDTPSWISSHPPTAQRVRD
ncbi:MAG TPA: M48 family metallopeptidase [Steroidobacteraceae bacterium]|nr:M48 family metallopeptidase [Steroidobacteraceae bacterium]